VKFVIPTVMSLNGAVWTVTPCTLV